MPQHDLVVDNGSGASVRNDINNALAALGSTMKGPNAPPAPIAGMMWLDDDTPSTSVWTLKIYDGADWISIATFDIPANTWMPSISLLRLAAGTAAAPSYSFEPDTDTGFYREGANSIGVAAGGKQIGAFQANSWFMLGDSALNQSIFYLYNGGASASQQRLLDITSTNEGFQPIVTLRANINTDGSGNLEVFATPAGSRASDRRVNRMTIPGSGPISMVGPVNVSSGELQVAGKPVQIQLGTVQNTTSGTFRDFPSIPAGVREITVMLDGVSTNGTSRPLIQLGDSGGVEVTGYNCVSDQGIEGSANSLANDTAGFGIRLALANQTIFGAATLSLLDPATNTWAIQGLFCDTVNTRVARVYGTKSLSAELDRIRLTTVNGTDTFDAGKMNINWKF